MIQTRMMLHALLTFNIVIQRFISVDICADALNHHRNSDLVVKISKVFFDKISAQHFVTLEN